MRIEIKEKLIPYSQTPGMTLLLPKTFFCLQIFPTRICFEEKEMKQKFSIDWNLSGPGEFFVFQDLEKQQILVDYRKDQTSFRFHVRAEDKHICVSIEKAPQEGVFYKFSSEGFFQELPEKAKEKIFSKEEIKIQMSLKGRGDKDADFVVLDGDIADQNSLSQIHSNQCRASQGFINQERLFLGMTKSLEIEKVQKRKNLQELLPLWLCLSQKTPKVLLLSRKKHEGCASLLQDLETLLQNKEEKIHIEQKFLSLYLAGFSSFFIPRLKDEQHQGIISEDLERNVSLDASPFILLEEGAKLIRSLFFREEGAKNKDEKNKDRKDKKENSKEEEEKEGEIEEEKEDIKGATEEKEEVKLFFLPMLLPSFHSGKMTNISSSLGKIDLEWSKKLLKKVVFEPQKDGKVQLVLQSAIKKFRVREIQCKREAKGEGERIRSGKKDFGKVYSVHEPLFVKKGQRLFLDHFEK